MSCKCETPLEALGLPSCALVPERIKRFIFTTAVVPSREPNSGVTTLADAWPDPPFTAGALWRDMWRLVTPVLDLVETERGDPVTEQVGENTYFVRRGTRRFRGIAARTAVELGRRLERLRCSPLGVFLVDANWIVWGMRAPNAPVDDVMPIPIVPGTINAQAALAGVDTVYKQEFSFEVASSFGDGDLVPIMDAQALASYEAPMAVMGDGRWTSTGDLRIRIYSEFARGPFAGGSIRINHEGIDSYLQLQTLNGVPLTATWTDLGNGEYEATGPSPQPVQVVIPASQWAAIWVATNRRFDWPSLRIIVRP